MTFEQLSGLGVLLLGPIAVSATFLALEWIIRRLS